MRLSQLLIKETEKLTEIAVKRISAASKSTLELLPEGKTKELSSAAIVRCTATPVGFAARVNEDRAAFQYIASTPAFLAETPDFPVARVLCW